MCKVISVANQKGGVAKSTTTLNLGVGLVREGKKVLVIDADPQGNLSQSLGIENPDELESFIDRCGSTGKFNCKSWICRTG